VRFVGIVAGLVAPALYAALLSVDPGVLPPELLATLAVTRQGLPYPVLLEDLLQLVILDGVTLAAEMAPGSLGQALTIVGSLIIGQAAVEAHLTSSLMVIILSVVLIGNLLNRDLRLGYALRIVKYPLTVLAGIFGLVGLTLGLLVLTVHLASLKSIDVPYLSPLAPVHWRRLLENGKRTLPKPRRRSRLASRRRPAGAGPW
jgi:hypothetical protein